MGFFDRLTQVWKGFLSLWVSDLENRNPEAVYEAAIEERIKKHRELKKAVSGIVYLRNKLQAELDQKEKSLAEIELQLPVAVQEGQDDIALVLIEKRNSLQASVAELRIELEKVSGQAEDAKSGLVAFQSEIEKLKDEKVQMLAKKANADAIIQINDTMSGLSLEPDIKALENVRETIGQRVAEANVGSEINNESLDARLAKIKKTAGSVAAQNELAQLKQQMAAQQSAQAAGAGVKKTI